MVALGAVLVLVGLGVLVIEAHVSTAGVLAVAGVMAAAAGVGVIVAGSGAALFVAIPVSVVLALVGLVAILMVAREVVVARRQEIRTGPTALVGSVAKVSTWSGEEGQVATDGALWHALLAYGWEDPRPKPGDTVIVDQLEGLTVSVRRPHAWEVTPVWKPSSLSL
ncbi:NfeD family protein [Leekyejoonella antrihumi]|uniref:Serine protease n=1 Tax=Leekyejoonella antrihumi TaxID=1660198 RepID=A0A563DTW4_9MICO|nr:NfeD family protein [Leekyejoonella antrihumi]TWP33616.1 serine protease [Leekyejoonella antrihumi]